MESSVAEDCAGEFEEGLVDLGVAFVSGAQPAEVVQVGEGALDDPAVGAQVRAVFDTAAGDHRFDPARP